MTGDTPRGSRLCIPPPLIAIAFGALAWWLSRNWPAVRFAGPWTEPLGIGLILAGAAIMFGGMLQCARARTTVNPGRFDNVNALLRTGVYRFTRNPMYLGLLLALTGFVIRLGALSAFIVLPGYWWWMTALQIRREERALATIFGDEYRAYCQRTRRWL